VKVILDSVQRLQFNDFRISMRGFKMRGNIQLFISFQITSISHQNKVPFSPSTHQQPLSATELHYYVAISLPRHAVL
jgi:hypothetical protein